MLNTETGWINRFLEFAGVPNENLPGWANDVNWVYPTYVIMGIWGIGNAMLIMLAGLQGVPKARRLAGQLEEQDGGIRGAQCHWRQEASTSRAADELPGAVPQIGGGDCVFQQREPATNRRC